MATSITAAMRPTPSPDRRLSRLSKLCSKCNSHS
uniref:Uncharacterized protein n=1 Tax=Macrostomum lignano TaxID=282301 RepID=A0A1I8IJJ3_9PLAT